MKNSPSLTGTIEWHEAPDGTTHAYRSPGLSYWMRQTTRTWQFWKASTGKWEHDPNPRPQYHIARPNSTCPDDATHISARSGLPYKAGPNRHARAWSTYNREPAWVCASSVLNTDLDDPELFTPINRTETPNEVTFTMSAEESKAIALEKRPMQVVACVFSNDEGAKEYHYFAPAEARAGQFAVIYADRGVTQNREFPFGVVRIIRDNVLDVHGKANKAILGTFDEEFAKHVQARMEHMARVKAQLQQKKKQFEENAIFEMLAQRDPEAAALLAELQAFQV